MAGFRCSENVLRVQTAFLDSVLLYVLQSPGGGPQQLRAVHPSYEDDFFPKVLVSSRVGSDWPSLGHMLQAKAHFPSIHSMSQD